MIGLHRNSMNYKKVSSIPRLIVIYSKSYVIGLRGIGLIHPLPLEMKNVSNRSFPLKTPPKSLKCSMYNLDNYNTRVVDHTATHNIRQDMIETGRALTSFNIVKC